MLKVAIRAALGHRLRLLATGGGVVLGVAFLAGSLILTDTIRQTFDDLFAEVNAGRDAVLRRAFSIQSGFEADRRGRVDGSLLDVVRDVEGVAHAEGEVGGFAQIVGRDGEPLGMPGEGPPTFGVSWPDRQELNPWVLAEGRAPTATAEVVVDKRSAEVGDLEIGEVVTVLTKRGPVELTLVGIVRFGDADSPGGASIASFELETAQRLLAEPGEFDQIVVIGEEGIGQAELAGRLATIAPEDVEVLTGGEFTEDQQEQVGEGVGFFQTFLLVFAGVGLFVGGFAINNTFSIITAHRVRETALLRAVGASRRQVLVSLVAEAAILGVVATALGIAVGFLIAAGLKALLAGFGVDVPAAGLVFRSRTAVAAAIVGVGVTVVSVLVPAWRASRVAPLAAIREVAVDEAGGSWARRVVGGVILTLGVLLLLRSVVRGGLGFLGAGGALTFIAVAVLGASLVRPVGSVLAAPAPRLRGMVGKLARENLLRNPRRTSATAAALMVGVGVVAAITVLASSIQASIKHTIDESIRSDFVIEPTSVGSGIGTDLADQLRDRREVAAAVPVRDEFVTIEGERDRLVGLDAAQAPEVFDVGADEDRLARLGPGEIVVHERTAESRGWVVGEEIEVRFADTGTQRLTVALLHEEAFVAGALFVDLSTFEANVTDQFDSRIFVKAAQEAGSVRTVIEDLAADFANAEVRDLTDFKESQAAQLDQLLGLVFSLLALAIVIALFGIANALSLAILERTRELGLLRAVGMTRRQLRSAVRWEAVLVAFFGTVLGLVVGLVFAWAFTAVADGLLFRLPVGRVAIIAVVATLTGALAAIGPTRRAARLDVLEAVAYE